MKPIHQRYAFFFILIPILGITFAPLATSICYRPDGIGAVNPIYQPCNFIKDTISMCCATNRSNPAGGNSLNGPTADECLPNGLCMNIETHNNSAGIWSTNVTYWVNQCTSPDWKNNGCLDLTLCPAHLSDLSNQPDFSIRMISCDGTSNSTTWCCGDNSSCCNTQYAFTIAQKLGEHTSTSTSLFISSSTSSMSSLSSSFQLSGGVVAGIAVGSVLGAIAFLAIVSFYFVRRKKKKLRRKNEAEVLAIRLGRFSRPRELENHIQSVAHEKATSARDIRAELASDIRSELPSEPMGRRVD